MTAQLEERREGEYTVRELTLGQLLDLRAEHAGKGGGEMAVAMLGAAVYNGSGTPIGIDAARELPARLGMKLSTIVNELTVADEETAKNA